MKCLKCGTAITSDQVFCKECREDMEKHPVDPGTPVVLPYHPERIVTKAPKKKVRKPEEQIVFLRKLAFWQSVAIMVLMIALTLAVILLVNSASQLPLGI